MACEREQVKNMVPAMVVVAKLPGAAAFKFQREDATTPRCFNPMNEFALVLRTSGGVIRNMAGL